MKQNLIIVFVISFPFFVLSGSSKVSVIYGVINPQRNIDYVQVTVFQWSDHTTQSYNFIVNASGEFEAKILIDKTIDVNLVYGENIFSLLIQPNDTIKVELHRRENSIYDLNVYDDENLCLKAYKDSLIKKSPKVSNYIIANSLSYPDYRSYQDSLYKEEQSFNSMFLNQDSCSKIFICWLENKTQAAYYTNLIEYFLINSLYENADTFIVDIMNSLSYVENVQISSLEYSLLINKLSSLLFRTAIMSNKNTSEDSSSENGSIVLSGLNKDFRTYMEMLTHLPNSYLRDVLVVYKFLQLKSNSDFDYYKPFLIESISDVEIKSIIKTY